METSNIPISIGLPFYNAEDYLEMAIKSVFAQTHTNWELILVDDGSTDGSLDIAKSIDDPRVRVYSDGKNKKLAARLNQIVSLAKYDLIARMDADDLMATNRIEKQIKVLLDNPQVDLISSGCLSINNNLKYLGSRGAELEGISFEDILSKKATPLHASIVGYTAWFKRNNYDESIKIAQDYDLWLKSSKNNDLKVLLIPDRLYFYREENNVTLEKILKAYKNESIMYKKYAGKHYYKLWLKSKVKTIIAWTIFKLNKQEILLKRRSHSLNESMHKENLANELKKIKLTALPKIKKKTTSLESGN